MSHHNQYMISMHICLLLQTVIMSMPITANWHQRLELSSNPWWLGWITILNEKNTFGFYNVHTRFNSSGISVCSLLAFPMSIIMNQWRRFERNQNRENIPADKRQTYPSVDKVGFISFGSLRCLYCVCCSFNCILITHSPFSPLARGMLNDTKWKMKLPGTPFANMIQLSSQHE